MEIDHQRFKLTDGEFGFRFLSLYLAYIDSCKGRIVCKVKSYLTSGLANEQSGELVSIAESELDQKSCSVNDEYIEAGHIDLGGEIQAIGSVRQIMYDKLYLTS